MKTDKLARNDLSPAAYDWYRGYLAAMDGKDLDAYGGYLADDCVMFINNDGPVTGKAAILGMLGPYWQSFATIEHDLLTILGDDGEFMLEALNDYRRLDGDAVTLRAVAVTARRDDGQVASVRLYTDTAPLFDQRAA